MFLAIASATADLDSGEHLDPNHAQLQDAHYGNTILEYLVDLLDTIDGIAGTEYHDEFTEFSNQLQQQQFLSNVSGLLLVYALSDEDAIISFVNSYIQQVVPMWAELGELSELESPHPRKLLLQYRQWGSLAEDACPPVVAVIQYLNNEEVDFDDVKNLDLNNYVENIESFDFLPTLGANLDSNIRNSVLHGGSQGGPDIDPISRTIVFTYEVGETVEQTEMSFGKFKKHTFETQGAVTALFVLPLYLVAIHSCTKITEWTENKGEGETIV